MKIFLFQIYQIIVINNDVRFNNLCNIFCIVFSFFNRAYFDNFYIILIIKFKKKTEIFQTQNGKIKLLQMMNILTQD